MNRGNGVSRRKMFGTFLAAAIAPLTGKARAALGRSRRYAMRQDYAGQALRRQVTTYVYDSQGRLIGVVEPHVAEVASFTYDDAAPWIGTK